jgi:alpha-glucosidase
MYGFDFACRMIIAAHCLLCSAAATLIAAPVGDGDWSVISPNGNIKFQILEHDPEGLQYQLFLGSETVIEPSRLGITIDGVDLGRGAQVERIQRYEMDDQFPSRGIHATARNHFTGAKFNIVNAGTNSRHILDVRAYDNGVAFRQVVPGNGLRTPDAAIEFRIPPGSTVWHHDLRGHYEGVHAEDGVEHIAADTWMAPPLTFKLPQDAGYASITEAALLNYAGMALQAGENGVMRERLGHSQPLGHPFTLRFKKEEGERLSHPVAIDGDITTPWRVVIIGKDLNTLVNCDIIESISPPPDKDLFPQGQTTSWIKPGRCVWKFLDGGDSDLESMKEFSHWAAELGFEYHLVEGFWQRWSAEDLRSFVEYSKSFNVGIWLWKDSRALRTPKERTEFFTLCRDVGVVGVKIDFLDHEAKEVIDLYAILLREAAQHELMVNFHGANKPAGEARTWPNELTREGVRGLEARRLDSRSRHNATIPFTRYLAGHGDYTPVAFGERRGDTTAAHQIATAAIFTSPLLVYGCHPQRMLEHPAADMIKSIPSIWDETIVLPGSEIGRVAAFARRRGDQWFLAIVSGPKGQKLQVSLSFLASGSYRAMLVRDVESDPTAVAIENLELTPADSLDIELADGGGFIGRFSASEPLSVIDSSR